MPTTSTRVGRLPKLLLHKPSGRARIRVAGKDIYLGPYGSPEAQLAYAEEIKKLVAGTPETVAVQAEKLVSELLVAFLRHAKQHYQKGGKLTSEWHNFLSAARPLKVLFASTPVNEFGPLSLEAVQLRMVKAGWARKTINRAIGRIRHIFKWGVSREIVRSTTLLALQSLAPLQEGRTEAHDNPLRDAVPAEAIDAVKSDVSPLVADLIELQRLTGCRSGELINLTTGIISREGPVWLADLRNHKTIHKGLRRILAFGPKAQAILTKYLHADPDHKLFPIKTAAYRRSITRACDRLDIERWVPHQLRHTLGTRVREEFSLDHSQAVLGHAKRGTTEDYSKVKTERAVEVAIKIG